MAIAFSCECGAAVSVPDSLAGKKGKCPTCGKPLVAPSKSTLVTVGAPDTFKVASHDLTASKDLAVSGDIDEDKAPRPVAPAPKVPSMRFRCPKCKKTLTVPLKLAGQTGKCGGCGASFTAPVPEAVKQARARAAAAAPPPSLRDAFSVVKVRCDCGMTSAVPKARAQSGTEKCPACGQVLELGLDVAPGEGSDDD